MIKKIFLPFDKSPALSNGQAQKITNLPFQLQHHPVEMSGKANETRICFVFFGQSSGAGGLSRSPDMTPLPWGPGIPCDSRLAWVGRATALFPAASIYIWFDL